MNFVQITEFDWLPAGSFRRNIQKSISYQTKRRMKLILCRLLSDIRLYIKFVFGSFLIILVSMAA